MTPSFFAAAINHLLERDEAARRRLAQHAGKLARIDTGVIDLRLAVQPGGAVATATADAVPDVSIFIKAGDLPLLLQDRDRAFSHVRIEGDAELANTLSHLLNTLRWDPEDDLSSVVGDVAAVRIGQAARKGWQRARSLHASAMENLAEYLLEENPTLVRRQALDEMGEAISTMRDDVERLAKRIDKLKGRA